MPHEKVVIRRPVRPKEAVQAGRRQEATFTTRMMAKLSQKDKPMLPPTIPVDSVATAMLALNQKVQAFQTCVVLLNLSSSVTLSIPPVSMESFFAQARNPLRTVPFSMEAVSEDFSAESCLISILESIS